MNENDRFLSQYFNVAFDTDQTKTASAEEGPTEADIQQFAKVAADSGIDLDALSPEQIQKLWGNYQSKLAESEEEKKDAPPPFAAKKEKKDEEDHEKKARALVDSIQKEAGVNQEVADNGALLGQVAAYSYVGTLQKIAAAGGFAFLGIPGTEGEKTAGAAGKALEAVKNYGRGAAKNVSHGVESFRTGKEMARMNEGASVHGFLAGRKSMREGAKEVAKGVGKVVVPAAAVGAAGAAAAAASRKKEASDQEALAAFNYAAANKALELLKEAGADDAEALQQVQSAYNVQHVMPDPTAKIAAAANYDEAVLARALEFVELAGYNLQGG